MAYCTPQTLSGIATECGSNVGGVLATAYRNRADIADIRIVDGVVTAITLADSPTSDDAAVLSFRKGTCSLVSESTIDQQAGTFFYTNTISHRFAKMDASKRASIAALSHAESIALVKDANGVVWLVGNEEALTAASVSGNTGTAHTDANEYTPTFSCISPELPFTVAPEAVAAFLGRAIW